MKLLSALSYTGNVLFAVLVGASLAIGALTYRAVQEDKAMLAEVIEEDEQARTADVFTISMDSRRAAMHLHDHLIFGGGYYEVEVYAVESNRFEFTCLKIR